MTGSRSPIISLLTDFGDDDEYVGVMKGAILCRAPHTVIIDLCHHIVPHDIRQAAHMIEAAFGYFPEGTLHVMVVDPGVGGQRGIVFAQSRHYGFLCPDNGLLTGLIARGTIEKACYVTNPTFFHDTVSATFHGRDIFAPVAGYLSSGGKAENLGPRLDVGKLVCLSETAAYVDGQGRLSGTVVTIDRFGNIITNIGRDLLTSAWEGDLNQHLIIEAGNRLHKMPLVTSYDAVGTGELLATIGSRNTLEIAVNQGSAAPRMGVLAGAPIRVARTYKDD
jgi:hypothetical protein